MTRLLSFEESDLKIQQLLGARQYGDALALVEQALEQWNGNAYLLRQRARLIQLGDESAPSLDEAAQALVGACELEPEAPACEFELAMFRFKVEDDAHAAEPHFDRSVTLAKQQLVEALRGKIEIALEQERAIAAKWIGQLERLIDLFDDRADHPMANGSPSTLTIEAMQDRFDQLCSKLGR